MGGVRVPEVVGGRFVLCDPVGRGVAGTVWRAWDQRHGRFCAAKLVHRPDDGGALRLLRDEGVLLRHPHLLTPYTWVEDGDRLLLATPLAAGGSVRMLLEANGPLAPATVADLLDQLLAGLGHLHAAGIAHRGVRAGTLLLDATYGGPARLRLAGFGRACAGDGDSDLVAAAEIAAGLLDGPAPGRLGAVLAALRAPDPQDRPTPEGAREALRVGRPAAPPRTASGARVVLLDRLAALPAGWTTEGPTVPVIPPPLAPAAPPTPAGRRPEHAARRRPAAEHAARRPAGRDGRVGAIAVATVLVLAGAGIVVARTGAGPETAPTAPAGPAGTAGTVTPTPPGPIAEGAPCGWQREGDAVSGAGGQALRCVLTGRGYRWTSG